MKIYEEVCISILLNALCLFFLCVTVWNHYFFGLAIVGCGAGLFNMYYAGKIVNYKQIQEIRAEFREIE